MKSHTARAADRYGPVSFIAAMTTITIVQTAIWSWFPWWILNLYVWGLASVLVLPTGFLLTLARGKVSQVGRGMLIGYLATPLTVAIGTVVVLLAVS